MTNGTHAIAVRETSAKGGQTITGPRSVTVSNAARLPSNGMIDEPAQGADVSGTVNVSGWFLDGDGVAKVEVLVDGVLQGQAVYGDSRPDVADAFPDYQNSNAGYHYSLDTTALTNGTHAIAVRETSAKGGQTITGPRSVTVFNAASLPSNGMIDEPAQGADVNGTVNVKGWFLDGDGVAKVEVLVDGVLQGQAVYGDSRPDVISVRPYCKGEML